jgi:tetratricopeptide (TPR) repeat protein
LNVSSIHLEPLDHEERGQLISNLLSEATTPPQVAAQVGDLSEGNPLFAEELLLMLIDKGLLRHEDDHWSVAGELSELPVPSTIQAVLAARLERLPQDERALLAHASVEGVVFHRGALDEVAHPAQEAVIDRNLTSLIRRDVIRPDRPLFPQEDAFRFRHVLIQDAAYRSLLKEARAELHERVAAWLEQAAGPRLGEFEEIVGYHLEQAHRILVELVVPSDQPNTWAARTAKLAARAANLLSSAGERAGARGDVPAAEKLFGRAESLLPDGEDKRDVQLERAFAIAERGGEGDAARAQRITAEVASAPDARADTRVTAAVADAYLRLSIGLDKSTGPVREAAQHAIPTLTSYGNHAWLSIAHSYLAFVDSTIGHWREATNSFENALQAARQAGATRQETEVLWFMTGALHYGPLPVEEGIDRLRTMLGPLTEHPPGGQRLSSWQRTLVESTGLAGLEAMRGDARAARRHAENVKSICVELGRLKLAVAYQVSGWVALLTEDLLTAEADLVESFQLLESMGDLGYLSTTAGFLAIAQYRQGRVDEAMASAESAAEMAVPDDVITQVLWRITYGKAIARRGDVDGGEGVVRMAISIAAKTDNLNLRGDSYFALAEVLRDDGRSGEALEAISKAIPLYEKKGSVVSEDKAIAFRASLP